LFPTELSSAERNKDHNKAAITHNKIIESNAITARKTITAVIATMSLKRFGAVNIMKYTRVCNAFIVCDRSLKLQQLPPSCSVATLHKASICFTAHILKPTKNKALLRYTQV